MSKRLKLAAGFLFVACVLRAEIIDRIAVAVGSTVITESQIIQQIRLTALQNGEKPDFSADSKRAAADRLIEQVLIRNEIQANRYAAIEPPNPDQLLADFRKSHFKSDAEYQQALTSYGVSETELKQQLQWQMTLVPFIDVRFRPGIQIPETEIKDYYEKQYVPEWKRSHKEATPSYEESRETIESLLTSQRADHALDRWIGQVRTHTRIKYYDEVLQ
jgi:hypothetical protein